MSRRATEEMVMKHLLIATAAFAALAGAAVAQPASDPNQGQPPSDYPPCTQPGQDRCVAGGHHMRGHHMHMKRHDKDKGASSKDGERG
jgi:hypothetical protein